MSGHNGTRPEKPKPERQQTEIASERNGLKYNRPQTETPINLKGQAEKATDHKVPEPNRPQTVMDSNYLIISTNETGET